jgi:hypothetical protein
MIDSVRQWVMDRNPPREAQYHIHELLEGANSKQQKACHGDYNINNILSEIYS